MALLLLVLAVGSARLRGAAATVSKAMTAATDLERGQLLSEE